jgi:nickel-dependent lactate racemase
MKEKTYLAYGNAEADIGDNELEELFSQALSKALSDINNNGSVIILPPDITRYHSRAGFLTDIASGRLKDRLGAILPALGTHTPMNNEEINRMFPASPGGKFLIHDWRRDVSELGRLEADFVEKTTEGAARYDWPVQVNKLLHNSHPDSGNFALAVSIGQVVPHEVAGMANHAKNIFVGTGGKEAIDKSHFAGASYGMEKIMGRAGNPVRALFNEGLRRYAKDMPPVLWVLTVLAPRKTGKDKGSPALRGIFIGFGNECFEKAAALACEVNVEILEEPVQKALVCLDPLEYRTTWLGNKAIYRTRMAIADGGELIILAPALEHFGEDMEIDSLIRKYGYCPAKEMLDMASKYDDLASNLSAAAHLIHGSSEGRFTVRYCPGEKVSRREIESVHFSWGDLDREMKRYNIDKLSGGWNTLENGEKVFFIPNPALGLWAEKKRFNR